MSRASTSIPPSLRNLWRFQDQFGRAALDDIMAQAQKPRAIVSRDTQQNGGWKLEEVGVRQPGEDELLVEMVASGVCHTDALVGNLPDGAAPIAFYPRVLGHEGSGYVKAVGPGVTVAAPGDPVLLSFTFCGTCAICKRGHYSHCSDFNPHNFGGPHPVFSSGAEGASSAPDISGAFFGQSSFASLSIVKSKSVVNAKGLVKDKEELALFAPLGCGIQTGSGTVVNVAQAGPDDTICILGLGGVGLSAVMSAKLRGCRRIIGVDRVEARLKLARELGVTDAIDGSKLGDKSLVDAMREASDGVGPTITIDTTGAPPLIRAAIQAAANRSKVIQVGSAPFDFKLEIGVFDFMCRGVQYIGAIEGQAHAPEYVPKMIQWYREGQFPIDRMVKFLPAEEFERALHEMHDGTTIKPVLRWS